MDWMQILSVPLNVPFKVYCEKINTLKRIDSSKPPAFQKVLAKINDKHLKQCTTHKKKRTNFPVGVLFFFLKKKGTSYIFSSLLASCLHDTKHLCFKI